MPSLRSLRASTKLSQRTFAARLGVPSESYRAWESGRRQPPKDLVSQAARIASVCGTQIPMPLPHLAAVLGISEMTLRNAIRSGRLRTEDAPFMSGRAVIRATRSDGEDFLANRYRSSVTLPGVGSRALTLVCPTPAEASRRIRDLRARFSLSQSKLARQVGAANRAVVYQWESLKRRPSPILWLRLVALGA